jgi:hypothetical protein
MVAVPRRSYHHEVYRATVADKVQASSQVIPAADIKFVSKGLGLEAARLGADTLRERSRAAV